MTLSFKGRCWRLLLQIMFRQKNLTIAEYRSRSAQAARLMPKIPKGLTIEKIDINGMAAVWIRPIGADPRKIVIHLHGGGYVTGSIESSLMMCIAMAQTIQVTILLPEYRLAPEHPFPAALDDSLKCYHWLLSQGFQPSEIYISGDSAGGGLGLATVLALRGAGARLPAGVICFSPWVDLTNQNPSHLTKEKSDFILGTSVLQEWAISYTNQNNLTNPLVSPLFADFHGLPPFVIQVGSDEILLDDARLLAKQAQADGVKVELFEWQGLWHDWPALGNLIPETQQAFRNILPMLHSK